jgi:hypothetical protein
VKRILLLARTFFARFFESDLMPPGLPQAQLVIGSLAALAAPGLLLPARFAMKYDRIAYDPHVPAGVLSRMLLVDRLLFITLAMTAMGFVALVVWEGVFPDRRDARILGALPLPGRQLVAGRLLALAALAAIFVVGVNAVPTLMYGPTLAAYGGASSLVHGIVAHFVATASAGAFVFFSLIALQGVLLNVAGRRIAERLSVVMQIVFVVVLLQMIFFMPRVGGLLRADLRTAASDPLISAIPSIWFLGLYDLVGGRPDVGSGWLAGLALAATATSIVAAGGLVVATHRRLLRLALESREVRGRAGRLIAPVVRWVSDLPFRNPIERAAFEFTLRTLTRSRTHRMLMAMYVGVAIALVISGVVPLLLRSGLGALSTPDVTLLSAPLVITFLTLAGTRAVLAIPVEPKANWIIRLLEPADRGAALDGVRNALVALAAPAIVLAASSAAILWGAWPAIVHAVVCTIMAWLLAEIVLLRLDRLPFASTYFPGTGRLRTRWPLYLIAFTNYCFTTATVEPMLMARPRAFVWFSVAGLAAIAVARAVRLHIVRGLPGFTFEQEDPDAVFQGFRLSEGLAARTPASPDR